MRADAATTSPWLGSDAMGPLQIVWFKRDLRTADRQPLLQASRDGWARRWEVRMAEPFAPPPRPGGASPPAGPRSRPDSHHHRSGRQTPAECEKRSRPP
ncbi:MAG: hypothetical protein ACK6BG_08070 [Cyanobacteriota bacterium]